MQEQVSSHEAIYVVVDYLHSGSMLPGHFTHSVDSVLHGSMHPYELQKVVIDDVEQTEMVEVRPDGMYSRFAAVLHPRKHASAGKPRL
jgi:hypothetical protein